MNIPRVSNCSPYFKSGNHPSIPLWYRVTPFVNPREDDAITLKMQATSPDKKPPAIIFYDKEGNLYGPNDGIYYYPMPKPPRKETKYKLITQNSETDYTCDGNRMLDNAIEDIKLKHNLPDVIAAKEGKVIAKVRTNFQGINIPDSLNDITKPTILVVDEEIIFGIENPNVVAILGYPETPGGLGHIGTLLKNQLDLFGIFTNMEALHKLEKLNGKTVELELKDGKLFFEETTKAGVRRKVPEIKVPQLKYCNKVLSSEECTPDVIGGKAANLRKLEVMAEEGKIDAIIPKFVALPWGYLEKFHIDEIIRAYKSGDFTKSQNLFDESQQYYLAGGKMAELVNILKEKGIGRNGLMIRSCFNDEDLPNFSNAGVYDSLDMSGYPSYNPSSLKVNIGLVLNSKYKKSGYSIRKYYNIPDEDVQAGVVLQDRVDSKNCFTIYTDNGDGNLIIDYRTYTSYDDPKYNPVLCPHLYTYNKKTGKLTYQTKQVRVHAGANFDEKCRLMYSDPVEIDLTGDEELNKRLKKAIDNALAVEKEFGKPQDIEGGFDKDGQLYFWQTRYVVGLD